MRWYKHRRRALSVHGAGSNDSGTNLAGASAITPGGAGGASSSFRVLGAGGERQTEINKAGMTPGRGFFSTQPNREKFGPYPGGGPHATPFYNQQNRYGGPGADTDEISPVGQGPDRSRFQAYPAMPTRQMTNNRSSSPTLGGPNGAGSRGHPTLPILPFQAVQETEDYEQHDRDHTHSPEHRLAGPAVGGAIDPRNPETSPGPVPHRLSDGNMSVTSFYHDTWLPNNMDTSGMRPLVVNTGSRGETISPGSELTRDVPGLEERPESIAIWPGPGASDQINRWKAEQARRQEAARAQQRLYGLEDAEIGEAEVVSPTRGQQVGISPLQAQIHSHLGDVSPDDPESHRALRPSPARTPQVQSVEVDSYPFPTRASPHDERNGQFRLPETEIGSSNAHGGVLGSGVERKLVGGGG
jgi:hypothetical protein